MWYSSSYAYKKSITVQNGQVYETSSNFPVLVSVTDVNLKSTGNGGHVAQASGYDIIFVNSAEDTLLDFEIESWNATTGEIQAWVDTAVNSGADTTFYIYYGYSGATDISDAAGTWDSNFKGVWHMNQDPSGTPPQMLDSTSNNNDGTSYGTMTSADQVAGKIDGSIDFDGTDDAIGGSISGPTNCLGSVSAWIYPHTEGEGNQGRIIMLQPSSGWDVLFFDPSGTNRLKYAITDGSGDTLIRIGTNNDITLNAWNHIVVSYDGTNTASGIKIYVNGLEVTYTTTSGSNTITLSPTSYVIGANDTAGTNTFDGIIDEVKVSNSVRSLNWMKTEYANQNAPAAFLNFGSEIQAADAGFFGCNF